MFVSYLRTLKKAWQEGQKIKQDRPLWWFEGWKEVVMKLITPPPRSDTFLLFFFFFSHRHTTPLFRPSSFTHSRTHTGWCTSPFFSTWGSEEGQGDTQKQIEMLQWVLSWRDAWLIRCSLALLLHLQVCWSTHIQKQWPWHYSKKKKKKEKKSSLLSLALHWLGNPKNQCIV